MKSAETIERVPIHTDLDGVARVAGTPVTLDTFVGAFDAGGTGDEIAQQYSSVPLVDVYSAITYLLRAPRHRERSFHGIVNTHSIAS